MDNHDRLPDDELFEPDGHVTEVVLACLSDGELALIPEEASAHVDGCDTCTARLGATALLSVGTRDALLAMVVTESQAAEQFRAPAVVLAPASIAWPSQPAPSSRRRRPIPWLAIAAAMAIAIAGATPFWMEAVHDVPAAVPSFLRSLPLVARALSALLRSMLTSQAGAAVLMRWIVAGIFIMAGSAVARTMTRRQRSFEGGVG